MLAELGIAITLSLGQVRPLQIVEITTGPCEEEQRRFNAALEEDIFSKPLPPVTSTFVLTTSIGWNVRGEATYFATLLETGAPIREAVLLPTITVKEVTPEVAARRIASNVRLALAGRFGGGRD